VLPDGWRERVVRVETADTAGAVGWCLEPHDLAVSKLAAGREKDLEFVETMVRRNLVVPQTIRERLADTPTMPAERRELAEARLRAWAARAHRAP
jgi:hypothetical protein